MSGQNSNPRKPDGLPAAPSDAMPSPTEIVGKETDVLRNAVSEMRKAMLTEGIDENGTLGVWCKALQSALVALAVLVEMQTMRIEDRAEAMIRASKADEDRHSKLISETIVAIRRCEVQTEQSEKEQKAMVAEVARKLFHAMEDKLKNIMLVRQVRWNRQQNWSSVALVSVIMLSLFVSGMVLEDARSDQAVLARCLRQQVQNANGQAFCPIDVVRGAL